MQSELAWGGAEKRPFFDPLFFPLPVVTMTIICQLLSEASNWMCRSTVVISRASSRRGAGGRLKWCWNSYSPEGAQRERDLGIAEVALRAIGTKGHRHVAGYAVSGDVAAVAYFKIHRNWQWPCRSCVGLQRGTPNPTRRRAWPESSRRKLSYSWLCLGLTRSPVARRSLKRPKPP